MIDNNKLEKFDLYLENQLSEEEKREFESSLNSDQSLNEEFKTFSRILTEIKYSGRKDLKNKLKNIHISYIAEEETKPFSRTPFLKIAAAIAVLAIISGISYFKIYKPKSNKEVLFSEYFSPYMNISNTRGEKSDNLSFLQETAMYYYNNKEFDKAILNFEAMFKESDSVDTQAKFYYAVSCLGAGQNDKAIPVLTQLTKIPNSIFQEQTNWYLALAYVQTSDFDKASVVLRSIIKGKGFYSDKALDLLEKIN